MVFLTRGETALMDFHVELCQLVLHNLFLNDKKRLSSEVTKLFRRENRRGICEEL